MHPFLSHTLQSYSQELKSYLYVIDCKLEWHWFEDVAAYTDLYNMYNII